MLHKTERLTEREGETKETHTGENARIYVDQQARKKEKKKKTWTVQ